MLGSDILLVPLVLNSEVDAQVPLFEFNQQDNTKKHTTFRHHLGQSKPRSKTKTAPRTCQGPQATDQQKKAYKKNINPKSSSDQKPISSTYRSYLSKKDITTQERNRSRRT
jgi:hypothetical protein